MLAVTDGIKNKELPLAAQYAVLAVLWLTWIACVVWVRFREHENNQRLVRFAEPALIGVLLCQGFPLVLAGVGALTYRRSGATHELPVRYRALHRIFAALTVLAVAVFFTLGTAFLCMLPVKIRE
jgi:hypothetical protein